MLKTSAFIAGIAGAGLGLMIGSAAPASAAEIGVRHSHGTSVRNITHGRFEAETKIREAYAEASAGLSGGYDFSQTWTSEVDQTKTPVQADRASNYQTWENNDKGGSLGFGTAEGYENDRSGTIVERPTVFERDSVTTDSYDESKRWGGSGYVRGLVGLRSTDINEEYRFNGTDTSSFSELSTFSR